MPKTLTKIFRSIFVSFHIQDSKLENNNFDFIIKQNQNINISNNNYFCEKNMLKSKFISNNNILSLNRNNSNNDDDNQLNNNIINKRRTKSPNIDLRRINTQNNNNIYNIINNTYFPNIIISKKSLKKAIYLNQINLLTDSKEIVELYSEFIIILFKNGTENKNKIIFNVFKQFYEKETDSIFKSNFRKNIYKFYDLFKNVLIPAMNSFNNEYKIKDRIISIKKYLSKYEKDGEKIGGTIKNIYEKYAKHIPNFENLLKYKINNYDNIIFIELLKFFFVKEYSKDFWELLTSVIKKMNFFLILIFYKKLKVKL